MGKGSTRDIWLVRHGETEWARNGRHTSVTEVALTQAGEAQARALQERLASASFGLVLTSPRIRARRTADLAGYPDAEVTEDLAEWAYGDYEGLTTAQIHARDRRWSIWERGAPGGESPTDVMLRLDRLIERLRASQGPILCFGHGHALRVLAARWLGQSVAMGGALALDTASVSVLGRERARPAIIHWNG